MKKNLLLVVLCCLTMQYASAQGPKWLDKSKRAVFSVITYDKDNKITGNGNGFFISEDGTALSDCSTFKGAERAVIVDSDGKQMPVSLILGANDMYDVIKFRVDLGGSKITALPVAKVAPAVGSEIFLLGYSTQKERLYTAGKVREVSKIGEEHHYYTLDLKLDEKKVSCPVVNAEGEVFGIAQPAPAKDAETTSYAVGASYGASLSISALSYSDYTLQKIGIKKGLPSTEEQALVYLYMASAQVSNDEYIALLNDFIKEYPNSADGYLRRANYYIFSTEGNFLDKAAADMDKALSVTDKKDDAHYNIAKLIYSYQLTDPKAPYKDWSFDKALEEIRKAIALSPLPIYTQTEGDILFAQADYPGAYAAYEKVMASNLASPAVFFSAAKTKELMKADNKEVLALMDSCIAHCPTPVSPDNAPFLLERARVRMDMEQYRPAMLDYDAYYTAVNGRVNDTFYYYREQAALYAKQFQRALDDINKAIELNPNEPTYHTELGVINIRVGRNEDAQKALKQAIVLAPDYGEAYRLLGISQIQLKQKDDACASFAKAKELGDPAVDDLIGRHCK